MRGHPKKVSFTKQERLIYPENDTSFFKERGGNSMDWLTHAWNSIYEYLTEGALWIGLGQTILKIIVIIILAYVFKNIGSKVIDGVFSNKKHMPLKSTTNGKREQTLNNLSKNILSYFLMFVVVMMILDTFHVPIKTMLAGAGVAGLAIGFGAQNLVKDVIAGFFIIFENQFSVGDYIEIGDIEGDVLIVGMRNTKLRSYFGQTYIIPNGQINVLTNYSASNGFAMVEVNIPYETDILAVEKLVAETIISLPEKHDLFVGMPEINGVQALELSNYVLRIRAETIPVMQWEGARIIRKEVKGNLFENGIEIPSPRMVVYSKDEEKEIEE